MAALGGRRRGWRLRHRLEPRRDLRAPGGRGARPTGWGIGGFAGRMVPGALADLIGWRYAFLILAFMTLLAAIAILFMLPRETKFVRSEGFAASGAQMLRHLRQPQLIATYAV